MNSAGPCLPVQQTPRNSKPVSNYRDNILATNAVFQYFVAGIETVMLEECEEYKRKKLRGWSQSREEWETDAENWERSIAVESLKCTQEESLDRKVLREKCSRSRHSSASRNNLLVAFST